MKTASDSEGSAWASRDDQSATAEKHIQVRYCRWGIRNSCALGKKKQTAARFCTHQLRQLTKIKPDEWGLLDLEDLIRAPTPPKPSDGFRVLFLLTCKFTALIQKENSWSQMSRSYVQFPPGVLTFSTWGK